MLRRRALSAQIDELMRKHCANPVFVIIDVRPDVDGIPTTGYVSVEEVVEGLFRLDVCLRHTDHLDDRSLLRTLRGTVLRETIRDLPSGIGVVEWIDLSGGEDRSAYLSVHASDESRLAASERGQWIPGRLRPLADRDRHLPRPQEHA